MKFSDESLMAYADGELDVATREQVEAAIASDPEIARRVASHHQLRDTLRTGFDTVLQEPVPERLIAAARAVSAADANDRVTPFRRRTAPSFGSWRQWGALAASFLLGALVLRLATPPPGAGGPLTGKDGRIVAAGVLERALTSQLSSEQAGPAPVRIGVSFRSKAGDYCRTFQLDQAAGGLAGLACRDGGDWNVEILARAHSSAASDAQYRQAAAALPPAVVQTVDATIAGEPLDAAAEAAARAQQWQPTPSR
jgi:anti-sigma factor RsiW